MGGSCGGCGANLLRWPHPILAITLYDQKNRAGSYRHDDWISLHKLGSMTHYFLGPMVWSPVSLLRVLSGENRVEALLHFVPSWQHLISCYTLSLCLYQISPEMRCRKTKLRRVSRPGAEDARDQRLSRASTSATSREADKCRSLWPLLV